MAHEWRAKSFKSGNSVALRIPAGAGIAVGEEWRLLPDGVDFRLERLPPVRRKIDVDAFWGKSPGIGLIAPEDRVLEGRPSAVDQVDNVRL